MVDDVTRLALAARDGDAAAANTFVRATRAEVWRLAAALAGREVADDITQETYLRAFRALRRFEARSSARTWLLGIARHTCVDHVRAAVRRRRLDASVEPVAGVPDASATLAAIDLLRRLPAERRAAFVLTQVIGLSYAEAADVEGVPVGTIRSRVARARSDLVAAVERAYVS